MSALSRAQVLTALSRFVVYDREELAETDAALRAQVAALTKERDALERRLSNEILTQTEHTMYVVNPQIKDLQRQVAQYREVLEMCEQYTSVLTVDEPINKNIKQVLALPAGKGDDAS